MRLRNPFRPDPLARYIAGDTDPRRHGEPGLFTATVEVYLRDESALLAQRRLERLVGRWIDRGDVQAANITTIARTVPESGGDEQG